MRVNILTFDFATPLDAFGFAAHVCHAWPVDVLGERVVVETAETETVRWFALAYRGKEVSL